MIKTQTYLITCAAGIESSLIIELNSFGIDAEIEQTGRVTADLTLKQFYIVCLWSRVASRVLLPLLQVPVKTKQGHEPDLPEQLYQAAIEFDWSLAFSVEQSFIVKFSADKQFKVNQQFATLRIKDAVVDSFVDATGKRPDVAKEADTVIHVTVSKRGNTNQHDMIYCLDLTGTSLHRRGYRMAMTDAPLKENLAAALLYQTNWYQSNINPIFKDNVQISEQPYSAIFDPMCGSGTFLIEALLMWTHKAVGSDKKFSFVNWYGHDNQLWQTLLDEADKTHQNALNEPLPKVIGYDADVNAVQATHKNLVAAGFEENISSFVLEKRALANWSANLTKDLNNHHPLIVTNPPYGERLGDKDTNKSLYQALGMNFEQFVPNTDVAVIAAKIEDADVLPLEQTQTLRTHNGQLTIYLRQGTVLQNANSTIISDWKKQAIEFVDAQDLVNRLQKNLVKTQKQIKQLQKTGVVIQNARIYDADLPNYNLAIDIIGEFVHVQEYAAPKKIDPDKAKQNFNTALQAIRLVLDVNRNQVFIKTRRVQKGNSQYQKEQKKGKFYIAKEAGARFYINLTDYIDTGLFLDHRLIRTRIQKESQSKSVLNLYAYTCSVSVHAALGGAKKVTSVDLSNTYIDWGKRNFALNGFLQDDDRFEFISADVFEWLKGSPQSQDEKYDLIFIDPPTFSNSKKFGGTFEVQRDHISLIKRAMNRLNTDGVLYFSNNFRGFTLDDEINNLYEVTNITNETIGFDFQNKQKKIHQSWRISFKS